MSRNTEARSTVDYQFKVKLDAVDHANALPDVTLMFEAGANKLMTGFGSYGDKPCFVMTAVNHNGDIGGYPLASPTPTAAIVFNSPESIKLMKQQLSIIEKEFDQ
ncbi:MAG: hypothetical protein JKY34_02635 [Kordiimonadaceae bacterium]|nr:hypothetical protein [Kordiimonadaceae bacterium]